MVTDSPSIGLDIKGEQIVIPSIFNNNVIKQQKIYIIM